MNEIEQALKTLFTGGSPNDIATLIGNRFYADVLPQSPTMPAVVFSLLTGANIRSTDGPSALANPTFQIDCWASNPAGRAALFKAVRQRLDTFSGTVEGVVIQGIFLVRYRDLYDNETRLYRRTADFSIWHGESVNG